MTETVAAPDLGALAVQGATLGCPTCRRWVGVLLYDADGYLQCRRCRNERVGIELKEETAS